MPSQKKYLVWTWFDGDVPKFVGWGRAGQQHPAQKLWDRRVDAYSDLNDWLMSLKSEPKRVDQAGIVRYYRHEAATVAASLRDKYVKQGHKLLDPRPWGTKSGGGAARQVMDPEFTIFGSVRQAAVDHQVSAATITRWCQTDGTGWDYLN